MHGVAGRVVRVVVNGWRAEAQVDDAYVVGRAVLQYPVERGQKRRGRAAPLRIQHTQADDLRAGGSPPAARRYRGDVCSVSVWIVCATLACEVNACGYAACAESVAEGFVSRVNARIAHGDAEPSAAGGARERK